MSFLKSAVNQVGRDLGKAVSNQIFKDNHSVPYRKVAQINNVSYSLDYQPQSTTLKKNFDKMIDFQMSHRPSTLIAKICGLYTVIKNESNNYISDGYLDTTESSSLFNMMSEFNDKVDDICDVLEIDEISNKKEINQLIVVVEKTKKLYKRVLEVSIEGCYNRSEEHKIQSKDIEKLDFLKYVGLHIIWMGNYARGKEKSIIKTILANLVDISTFIFPFTRTYLFLKGVFTFPNEKSKINKRIDAHEQLSILEKKRAETYLDIKESLE